MGGDLKIASVSAPLLDRATADVSARDGAASAPSSPTAAASAPTGASSAAKELMDPDARVAISTMTCATATAAAATSSSAASGSSESLCDENARWNRQAARAVMVAVDTIAASEDSDTAATDETGSASADEPPTSTESSDPVVVDLANRTTVAEIRDTSTEEKAPASEVQRKRKRSKRLGFSGSRPKQKRQSASASLQIQLPETPAVDETGDGETPESPIFGESAVLYPSTAMEATWDWSMSDVYYDPITQENLDQLVRARKSCANILAANLEACKGLQQETAHLTAMVSDASDTVSARVRPLRRGRRYRDVWEEEDFLAAQRKRDGLLVDKKRAFSDQETLLSNHDLVHGYDDDLFEAYIQQLETQAALEQSKARDAKVAAHGPTDKSSADSSDTKRSMKQQHASLTATVLPAAPVRECHPAAWGTWIIKKQTTCFDVIHPASLCRKSTPSRWNEEAKVLEQLESERLATDSMDAATDEDERDSVSAVGSQRSALPVATALWGNGKDEVAALPSFGTAIEEDEISREIATSLAKLLPLSMHNWRRAQTVYERAAMYAQCSSTLQHEAELSKRIEALYQRLYPPRTNADESESAALDGRVPVFHSRRSNLVAHSLKFCRDSEEEHCVAASVEYALTLQVGDEVDVLDRNGCWNDGVVVEVFRESGQIVKYVLVRLSLWDTSGAEWVSVTEGRILPRGVADGKVSFVVGPSSARKRRIEFNRALADTLEKTLSVRHVAQNAAATARKRTLMRSGESGDDVKQQQKKKVKRVL